jgi:hypothetical protein
MAHDLIRKLYDAQNAGEEGCGVTRNTVQELHSASSIEHAGQKKGGWLPVDLHESLNYRFLVAKE